MSIIKHLFFNNFGRVYRFDRWIKERFTPAGWLLLIGLILSAIFGLDTSQTLAYQIFSLLLMILLSALFSAFFFRPKIILSRKLPEFSSIDNRLIYQINCHNLSTKKISGLYYRENPNKVLPDWYTHNNTIAPGDEKLNWFDRSVGYPRWLWLIRQNIVCQTSDQKLPDLLPGDNFIEVTLMPIKRGQLYLPEMMLYHADSLGIYKACFKQSYKSILWVLPKIYALPEVNMIKGRQYQQSGVSLASSIGESDEFIGLRDYRPGDALKNIHWKSFAKAGKPIVKEFQDEYYCRFGLILDTFQQAGEQFEATLSVAASLINGISLHDVLLDMLLVGEKAYCFTAGRHIISNHELLKILTCIQPYPKKDFSIMASLIDAHQHQFSSCLCVLQCWDKARQTMLKKLMSLQIPVTVLIISEHSYHSNFIHIQNINPHSIHEDILKLQL